MPRPDECFMSKEEDILSALSATYWPSSRVQNPRKWTCPRERKRWFKKLLRRPLVIRDSWSTQGAQLRLMFPTTFSRPPNPTALRINSPRKEDRARCVNLIYFLERSQGPHSQTSARDGITIGLGVKTDQIIVIRVLFK